MGEEAEREKHQEPLDLRCPPHAPPAGAPLPQPPPLLRRRLASPKTSTPPQPQRSPRRPNGLSPARRLAPSPPLLPAHSRLPSPPEAPTPEPRTKPLVRRLVWGPGPRRRQRPGGAWRPSAPKCGGGEAPGCSPGKALAPGSRAPAVLRPPGEPPRLPPLWDAFASWHPRRIVKNSASFLCATEALNARTRRGGLNFSLQSTFFSSVAVRGGVQLGGVARSLKLG